MKGSCKCVRDNGNETLILLTHGHECFCESFLQVRHNGRQQRPDRLHWVISTSYEHATFKFRHIIRSRSKWLHKFLFLEVCSVQVVLNHWHGNLTAEFDDSQRGRCDVFIVFFYYSLEIRHKCALSRGFLLNHESNTICTNQQLFIRNRRDNSASCKLFRSVCISSPSFTTDWSIFCFDLVSCFFPFWFSSSCPGSYVLLWASSIFSFLSPVSIAPRTCKKKRYAG